MKPVRNICSQSLIYADWVYSRSKSTLVNDPLECEMACQRSWIDGDGGFISLAEDIVSYTPDADYLPTPS